MDERKEEAGYREAVEKFYEVYEPLRERYGLHMHSHSSISDDNSIKVWEHDGHCICLIKDKDESSCYRRAAETLEDYSTMKEEGKEDARKAG